MSNKIQKITICVLLAVTTSACSIHGNPRINKDFKIYPKNGSYDYLLRKDEETHCKAFGCGKDLNFYPMQTGEMERQAKACNWDWGTTSTAHAPGTAEYKRLRAEELRTGTAPDMCE